MSEPYYITTAIDYPNAPPHIGHAYEKVVADFYARWHRFLGEEVFFLTGTDENGQKLERSAKQAGFDETRAFVEQNVTYFKEFCHKIQLSHSDFIRTTEPRHSRSVHSFWQELQKNGDIYLGQYQGWYCYDCEQFYPENQLTAERMCPIHKKPLTFLKEDGYFFKTSRYHQALIDHIKSHEEFIFPKIIRTELLSRLEDDELYDLPISRTGSSWGIKVPQSAGEGDYVIYTWFDALINYYSVVMNGDLSTKAWPCDVHVIGKDIAWFHGVIWPAMLLSYGLPLPKTIYVHGMILDGEGKKMSKSLGNIIAPLDLLKYFPVDSLRYAFLRGVVSGRDGKLSWETLLSRHNQELANELGNLISRVIKLTLKKLPTPLAPPGDFVKSKHFQGPKDLLQELTKLIDHFQHHKALDHIFAQISQINIYLNDQKPWSLKDQNALHKIMYEVLYQIYILTTLLHPFLPNSSLKILSYLGADEKKVQEKSLKLPQSWNPPTFYLKDPDPVFAKITLPEEPPHEPLDQSLKNS